MEASTQKLKIKTEHQQTATAAWAQHLQSFVTSRTAEQKCHCSLNLMPAILTMSYIWCSNVIFSHKETTVFNSWSSLPSHNVYYLLLLSASVCAAFFSRVTSGATFTASGSRWHSTNSVKALKTTQCTESGWGKITHQTSSSLHLPWLLKEEMLHPSRRLPDASTTYTMCNIVKK